MVTKRPNYLIFLLLHMYRILYLSLNRAYINPTPGLIPLVLTETGSQIDFYGPGFQSQAILIKGLDSFVESNGPYDIVIGSEFCTTVPLSPSFDNTIVSNSYWGGAEVRKTLLAMHHWFQGYKGIRMVLLLETDAFNMKQLQAEFLEEHGGFIVTTWDANMMESISESADLFLEKYSDTANDLFFNFLCRNRHRTIALPHYISDSEVGWGCFHDRLEKISIPGVPYIYRKRAIEISKQHGMLYRNTPWLTLYAIAARLGFSVYDHWATMTHYRAQFIHQIDSSKYSYTCGSAQKMHIRKHLEIPARGSLMITAPIVGLERLGFRDKENCLVCLPDKLPDLFMNLSQNAEFLEKIANSGRKLIFEKHRVSHRAEQLKACFNSIIRKDFMGSTWENGNWIVN